MPTIPNVRAIDDAIIAMLAADPILAALMPGGVHWDVGPPGLTQFVTVTQSDFASELLFLNTSNDRIDYLIKAIDRNSSADPALDAAARIHDLLEQYPLDLAGTGYELMLLRRVRRVRFSESINSVVWQHAGGVYQVLTTCGDTAA